MAGPATRAAWRCDTIGPNRNLVSSSLDSIYVYSSSTHIVISASTAAQHHDCAYTELRFEFMIAPTILQQLVALSAPGTGEGAL